MNHQRFLRLAIILLAIFLLIVKAGCDSNSEPQNPEAKLLVAARNGDVAEIARLLENGVSINARNEAGVAALHYAARYGYQEMTAFLLKNGADPDVRSGREPDSSGQYDRGPTPLHIAIEHGQFDIAQLLLGAGANPDACTSHSMGPDAEWTHYGVSRQLSPLILAVMHDSTDAIDLLVRHGATVDPAKLRDMPPRLQRLAQHKRERDPENRPPNPLAHAVVNDRLNSAKHLVQKGAKMRPFMLLAAVEYGHDDVVTWLLDEGVAVNYSERWLVMSDRPTIENGKGGAGFLRPDCSAIEIAFEYRDRGLMRKLLQRGAQTDGLLHKAAAAGDISTIRMLLDHGVNITERNTDGLTPLQVAADRGNRECVEVLKNATE